MSAFCVLLSIKQIVQREYQNDLDFDHFEVCYMTPIVKYNLQENALKVLTSVILLHSTFDPG